MPISERTRKRALEDVTETVAHTRHRSVMDDALANLVCSITQELPVDPVTAEDGLIYERTAIQTWLKRQKTSPVTNLRMGSKLLPAPQVKSVIEAMARSGAIDGEKGSAWQKKLEEEKDFVALRQQAEAGDADAMREVARCFYLGLMGQTKDAGKAFHWYELAAKRGNVRALGGLGLCYVNGTGVGKNPTLGVGYQVESATRGNAFACANLGLYYFKGMGGLPEDLQQARRWLAKAKTCDNYDALEDDHKASTETLLSQCPASEWA